MVSAVEYLILSMIPEYRSLREIRNEKDRISKIAVAKLKRLLEEKLEEYRLNKWLLTGPPYNPIEVKFFGKAKIKYEESRNLGKYWGLLKPTESGFRVIIKENLHPYSKRTAYAHEIGHMFFYDTKILPPRKYGDPDDNEKYIWREEDVARFLARVFLIPQKDVDSMKIRNYNVENLPLIIDKVRKIFRVTYDVLFWRLIHDLGYWKFIYLRYKVTGWGGTRRYILVPNSSLRPGFLLKGKRIRMFQHLKIPKIISKSSDPLHLYNCLEKTLRNQNYWEECIITDNKVYLKRIHSNNIIIVYTI